MGNLCCVRSSYFPQERDREHRPVSVDRERETKTSGLLNVTTTVSQDRPTVARPHLITLCYPPNTPHNFTSKFPKKRVFKSYGEAVLLGRGLNVDVLLNEEHMSRQFVELRCVCDPNGEPKWFIKNMSERKPVRVTFNDVTTCLKFKEESELQDGCDLNIESLTFTVKTEDGDFGITGFELKIRKKRTEIVCADRSRQCVRQSSLISNDSYHSTASASTHLVRQGSTSSKVSEFKSTLPQHVAHGPPLTEETLSENQEVSSQHAVHSYQNIARQGSLGSICCPHHFPHGSAQCLQYNTCLQAAHVCSATSHQVSSCGHCHRDLQSKGASSFTTPDHFSPAWSNHPLQGHGIPAAQHQQVSSPHTLSPRLLQMSPVDALPEIWAVEPYSSVRYGPPAFHQRPLELGQRMLFRLQDRCQFKSTQQTPMLHRSQSLFTHGNHNPVERKRRSSCDGAEMAPVLAQPESALTSAPVTQCGATASFQSMQQTSRKVYNVPTENLTSAELSIQMADLKLGHSDLALSYNRSGPTDQFSNCPSYPNNLDALHYTAVPDLTSAHHNHKESGIPTESENSLVGALPSSTGFSTLYSATSADVQHGARVETNSGYSGRQPQENDERKPHEHHDHCQ